MAKQLTELADAELERSYDRTWKRHYDVMKEQERRDMIARYGSADYDALNGYQVELSIYVPSSEEAEQIGRERICVFAEATFRRINFDDNPEITFDSVELVEEAKAAE